MVILSEMAFERKWVSESNLDKLWHETLEKKEANKQRRSPDFCKEAILSATLKRISSEMVMRQISSPGLDMDDDSECTFEDSDNANDSLTLLSTMSTNSCDIDEECIMIKSTESLNWCDNECLTVLTNTEKCENVETTSSAKIESPKRKRDDDDLYSMESNTNLSGCSSPAKRQRCKPDRLASNSIDSKLKNTEHKHLCNLLKAKINGTAISASDPSVFNNGLMSPVKSVVSSISELSLNVPENWHPTASGSWCMPLTEPESQDPLELDGFFHNLKKVTS